MGLSGDRIVNPHTRLLLRATLAALVLLAGCKGPPTRPAGLCKTLSRANQKLAEKAQAFHQTVLPLNPDQKGPPVNVAAVRSAYQAMDAALQEVRDEVDDLQPPKGSSAGQDLLDKYKTYLGAEESILKKYEGIVKVVERNDIAPGEKWQFISATFTQILPEEEKALAPVRQAQQALAKEQHLELKMVR
jgi:hypothetical protein